MTSPYLLRPLRTLDTVLSEREKEMERPSWIIQTARARKRKLAEVIAEQEYLERSPTTAAGERRKVALCKRRVQLEQRIADLEYVKP